MDLGEVTAIIGVIIAFLSLILYIKYEGKKNQTKHLPRGVETLPSGERVIRRDDDPYHDATTPFLYISIGILGACGGVGFILVLYLLLEILRDKQWITYPLLLAGLIGGVLLALITDNHFNMEESKPLIRLILAAISGFFGAFIIIVAIIVWILYGLIKIFIAELSRPPSSTK